MVVCKFFQSGNCRYGANCRFDHPQNAGGQNSNQNRFGTLSGQNGRASDERKDQLWAINITDVKNDMTAGQGRPQWILSTYGPGRAPPASLLEDNEYSFEELRLRYYELAIAGSEAQANQEAAALWSKAEDGMRTIAQNADDVIKFMEEANQKHPNRYDFCQTDGSKTKEELVKAVESANVGFGQASANSFAKPSIGFGQPSQPVSAFGQPSQPAPSANSFAQPSVAQSANPFAQPSTASAFGKPAFGQSSFGQPSQPAVVGFGQPSPPAPAFGQPSQPASAFGQPSQSTLTFGQPSQPGQSASPFAKASIGFGQPSQPASAFGQPSQLPNSTFGTPAPPGPGGFAQSGFGQPSQPAAAGFGQPSQPAFGQPSQPTVGGFGQPSQSAPTFGQPSQSAPIGFGQPSQPMATGFNAGAGFAAESGSASPFGKPSAAVATGSFGQPSNPPASTGFSQPSSAAPSTGFAATPAASTGFAAAPNAQSAQIPNPLTGKPPVSFHYTETIPKRAANFRPGTKDVSSYAGRRVQYINEAPCYERPDGKGWERIWFPEFANGADVAALNVPGKKDDLEGNAEAYTDSVKQAYVHLLTKGGFGEAGMPTVPPMREWCAFDF